MEPAASPPVRPRSPLRRADVSINTPGEPALHGEPAAGIASADRVDLLCALIKWQGLRLLTHAIGEYHHRARRPRVVTTTYVRATERKAIDKLVALGTQVNIGCETRTTRLHAKVWLFRRDSFLGPAHLVTHTGSRPMAITWQLEHPIPAWFFETASMPAG